MLYLIAPSFLLCFCLTPDSFSLIICNLSFKKWILILKLQLILMHMVVKVYDLPPSKEYVKLVKVELLKTREDFAQALQDRAYAKKEVVKWCLIIEFFYKKALGYESS